MINAILNMINEFRSYFVPEKIKYEIVGECKKCGKCCNQIYSLGIESEKEFKFMQLIYPSYKRFYIKGKDEMGNIVFACKYVSNEGLCTVYKKRPSICKRYPKPRINYPLDLPAGCGFKIIKKSFNDYLKK